MNWKKSPFTRWQFFGIVHKNFLNQTHTSMKSVRLFLFIAFLEAIDSLKQLGSKKIKFLQKSYPQKPISKYGEGDIVIVLGFLEDHQPVVQDLVSYRRFPPYETYTEEGYVMLCPDFQNFLKVEERRAYQVKNGALVMVSVSIMGDKFIRS